MTEKPEPSQLIEIIAGAAEQLAVYRSGLAQQLTDLDAEIDQVRARILQMGGAAISSSRRSSRLDPLAALSEVARATARPLNGYHGNGHRVREAGEINPRTGRPFKLSAAVRRNMARGQLARRRQQLALVGGEKKKRKRSGTGSSKLSRAMRASWRRRRQEKEQAAAK